MRISPIPGSFRDPSGFLFSENNIIYRQVNHFYKDNYDLLMSSGLYDELVGTGKLVDHKEADKGNNEDCYKIIRPRQITFVSYPYEWSFSQMKAAALLTLHIQKTALGHGMSLKDASAYNVQFIGSRAVFIDTLSFEKYVEGRPWVAYRQFCQHFLAPLSLMSMTDVRLKDLMLRYIDGIPLDLAGRLLPIRSRFNLNLLIHIHMHARSQRRYSDKAVDMASGNFSLRSVLGLIGSLESAVNKLRWSPEGTEWAEYYEMTNYSDEALENKRAVVSDMIEKVAPPVLVDLGANTGIFSRIASKRGIYTVSADIDPSAVEKNYLMSLEEADANILPLALDLCSPSPSIGWANEERPSWQDRMPVDTVMALALIHHLAISNNLPLDKLSEFFSKTCKNLIIEFIPKEDSQVQKLLASREDIFHGYMQDTFEDEFSRHFDIEEVRRLKDSGRTIYLMRKKDLDVRQA